MTGNYTVNGKTVSLTQSDYSAAGGEGSIFVKGHNAYKLYHDPSKMIPEGKIHELAVLRPLTNVLGPLDVVYRGNRPLGFVMSYVKNCEFLSKLFSKGFRDKNGISPNDIAALAKIMQDTVKAIHGYKILLVDINPFNFLVSTRYDIPYFIDVDSYQTPSYSATALMESVRDRQVKNNKFTELSDFFSLGVVMFELYIGLHPFKGRHPDFTPKDWMQMMDKGISVFNRKCRLPPATQDLSVIPKGHLRWFEAIFEKGERSVPPEPDAIAPVGPTIAKVIQSNDKFSITLVHGFDLSNIVALRFIDGVCWAVTEKGIWGNGKLFAPLVPQNGYTASRLVHDLAPVQAEKPILLEWNRIDGRLSYSVIENTGLQQIGVIQSGGFFIANKCVYTVVGDSLIELSFVSHVKVIALQERAANVFHNYRVFDGLVLQDMLGTCRAAIPYQSGRCALVHIRELDRCRIVDAKYDSGVAIVISESAGCYKRYTFVFDKEHRSYSIRTESDIELADVNFTVKDNGVVVAENGEKLEVFLDNSRVKVFDSPLNGNERLVAYKNDVYVINGSGFFRINTK